MRQRTVLCLIACILACVGSNAATGGEPSAEFQAGVRRTLELRRLRHRGAVNLTPPGAVVAWPMPPTLVIRQTRERHDEISVLLDTLRYGGRLAD